MDQDEKLAMREDMLRDQHHERMMRTDIEYFCEYTVENLYLIPDGTSGIYLFDIVDRLRKKCNHYDQNIEDLLDYMKDI